MNLFKIKFDVYIIIFFVVFYYLSSELIKDFELGGNSWKQGDWLINSQSGLTRRFLPGDLILLISDLTNSSPLIVVILLQIFLIAGLFIMLHQLRDWAPNWLFFTLVTAPAFFVTFWSADEQGSARKEIIVFFAILLQLISIDRKQTFLFYTSSIVFAFAAFSHEALILFAPLIFCINYIFRSEKFLQVHAAKYNFIIFCSALAASVFAFAYQNTVASTDVCISLVRHEIDESFCDGAIKWLDYNSEHGFLDWNNWGSKAMLHHFVLTVFTFLPIVILTSENPKWKLLVLTCVLTSLPFLPLYFISIDWGRWLSFHFFAFFVIIISLIKSGSIPTPTMAFKMPLLIIFVLNTMIMTPHHNRFIVELGILHKIAN